MARVFFTLALLFTHQSFAFDATKIPCDQYLQGVINEHYFLSPDPSQKDLESQIKMARYPLNEVVDKNSTAQVSVNPAPKVTRVIDKKSASPPHIEVKNYHGQSQYQYLDPETKILDLAGTYLPSHQYEIDVTLWGPIASADLPKSPKNEMHREFHFVFDTTEEKGQILCQLTRVKSIKRLYKDARPDSIEVSSEACLQMRTDLQKDLFLAPVFDACKLMQKISEEPPVPLKPKTIKSESIKATGI